MWSKSNSSRSPAALDTEKAEPFPSPPSHLLNNLSIQSTLSELQGYVNTDTPFDIDNLELFLGSHPNQLFVRSIMRSLREGFWPFDEENGMNFPKTWQIIVRMNWIYLLFEISKIKNVGLNNGLPHSLSNISFWE